MNERKTQQPVVGPTCGACQREMTPENSTVMPEMFLCDRCAAETQTDETLRRLRGRAAASDSDKAPLADRTAFDSSAWLGVDQIRAERERQKEREGWGDEHDDGHRLGELVSAATCYLAAAQAQVVAEETGVPCSPVKELLSLWPWEPGWWRPTADPVRNLVKAGALIAAEIDRLDRERRKTPNDPSSPTPAREAADTNRNEAP